MGVMGNVRLDTAKAQNSAKAQKLLEPSFAFLRTFCVFAVIREN
jgi:hypothetical protein